MLFAEITLIDKNEHAGKEYERILWYNNNNVVFMAGNISDEQNAFNNGENITIDGGMSKLMIYSGDQEHHRE